MHFHSHVQTYRRRRGGGGDDDVDFRSLRLSMGLRSMQKEPWWPSPRHLFPLASRCLCSSFLSSASMAYLFSYTFFTSWAFTAVPVWLPCTLDPFHFQPCFCLFEIIGLQAGLGSFYICSSSALGFKGRQIPLAVLLNHDYQPRRTIDTNGVIGYVFARFNYLKYGYAALSDPNTDLTEQFANLSFKQSN